MDFLKEYVDEGRISIRQKEIEGNKYEIVCYTKDQFFNYDWDDVTITHRGAVYRDGIRINEPFNKVFNLNEHPSTDQAKVEGMLATKDFEVLDKLNGHLIIVTPDKYTGRVLIHTKGSLDGEFAEKATEWFQRRGLNQMILDLWPDCTFMFEAITSWDQHTLYERHRIDYGLEEDDMVLIGVINSHTYQSYNHHTLKVIGNRINVKVTKRLIDVERGLLFGDFSLESLKKARECEGFVIHFPSSGFRVKIKTDEYLRLRYMKEFGPQKVKARFARSGITELYRQMDEEMHGIVQSLVEDWQDWLVGQLNLDAVPKKYSMALKPDGREIYADQNLTKMQRIWLTQRSKIPLVRMFDKPEYRAKFRDDKSTPLHHMKAAIKDVFGEDIFD